MKQVLLAILILFSSGCAVNRPTDSPSQSKRVFCKPSEPCWPKADVWQSFAAKLKGKLEMPDSPLAPCRIDSTSNACTAAFKNLKNPFFISDHPGATQSAGWMGAWTSSPSTYAVAAENSNDIVEAVKFAHAHNLKLVIKGTGHDYFGRSNAPDSLLLWTHRMRKVQTENAFAPHGCDPSFQKIPAVSVQAGTQWLETYKEVTVKHGRFVLGGGCTTVGAAGGFLQGGGFGSWSKKFGTAAANLLEAEIVTAGGKLLIANSCQNQDLFWALRGGGGGTFGIVTRATMRTYPLPKYFGWLNGTITAKSDDDFKELLERFIDFYREHLNNEYWGEKVKIAGNNSLDVVLAFQGLNTAEAERIWKPFRSWMAANPAKFTEKLRFVAIPGRKMWDFKYFQQNFAAAIESDKRSGQPLENFWWAPGDAKQVSAYWYTFQSRWLPRELFEPANAKKLAEAFFQASRQWSIRLHFNKGQAGAAAEAVRLGLETSVNPELFNAAVLVTAGAEDEGFAGVKGHEPKVAEGEKQKLRVSAAMKPIYDLAPNAGTYSNESDYFERDWQKAYWGENYSKLLSIKKKYDPDSMFVCHHCVGSEQ